MNQKTLILGFVLLITLSISFFNASCKKKDIVKDIKIGDRYQEGIVAHVLQLGEPGYDARIQHGMIAASIDQSLGLTWDTGNHIITSAISKFFGAGHANTTIIVDTQGTGSYAAQLCADLDFGGYTDWVLPSTEELNYLYENKSVVGGFTNRGYWSSSEESRSYAWDQNFTNGSQFYNDKATQNCVRAVRAF